MLSKVLLLAVVCSVAYAQLGFFGGVGGAQRTQAARRRGLRARDQDRLGVGAKRNQQARNQLKANRGRRERLQAENQDQEELYANDAEFVNADVFNKESRRNKLQIAINLDQADDQAEGASISAGRKSNLAARGARRQRLAADAEEQENLAANEEGLDQEALNLQAANDDFFDFLDIEQLATGTDIRANGK